MNKYQREKQIKEEQAKRNAQIERIFVENARTFTDKDMSLVSSFFFGNEDLLVLRKYLLQGELTSHEESKIKSILANEQILSILKRSLIPVIDPNNPYSSDVWIDLKTQEKGEGELQNDIFSNLVMIRYFEQRLGIVGDYVVEGSDNQWENGDIQFKDLTPTGKEGYGAGYINLQARNCIINKLNGTINQLNAFAIQNQINENEDQREQMNSNK